MRQFLKTIYFFSLLFPFAAIAAPAQTPGIQNIKPVRATKSVSKDPDDPAIWVNRKDPGKSLVIGTNKIKASEGGAIYVFDLSGNIRQIVPGLDRPNNVDVEYGLQLGGKSYDIVVVTERLQHRLRVFAIVPQTGKLIDLAPEGLPVFAGESGEASEPMGIALYKRPTDKAIFAVVGRKSGPAKGYLHIYRLQQDHRGKLVGTFVKAFGSYSGKKEIEAIAVDDASGYVYYADERVCIRKYPVDPANPFFGQELATLGREGFQADHEGIALYTRSDGTGYIVCTDQIPLSEGGTCYHIYRREGEPGNRHDHSHLLAVVNGGADETDGIEITATPLGTAFPRGLFVAMNSGPKNFLLFDAAKVIKSDTTPGVPPHSVR